MMTAAWNNERLRSALAYAAAALLSLAVAAQVLQLRKADLRVPLAYDGDALMLGIAVKGTIEHGWFLDNPSVGAPGGTNLADFPTDDNLHFLVIKLIGLATRDAGLTVNLYFLLTFPLAALAALFVMRRLGLARAPAVVASVLFAVLPYHFLRGEWHMFLARYYLVPLVVLVAVRLHRGQPLRWRWLGAAAVCLLAASSGVYYAFFACIFFLVAVLAAALRRRSYRPLAAGAALVALTVAGGVANLAPTLLYRHEHGPNPTAVHRQAWEGEFYGLKVAQLVLPITDHRLRLLAAVKRHYNSAPHSVESDYASLGAVGAAGFLGLLGWSLLRRRGDEGPDLPDSLALFNLVAVLLATVGGLGALFSLLVTSWVRAYNRVSVFIAFFALAAVAWALGRLAERWSAWPRGRRALYGLLALLLVGGAADQTSPRYTPNHPLLRDKFANDARFVRAVEERLPPGSMVLQLPYVPFPEHPAVHRMKDYDHVRPYLHSRALRWSYGAVKGREADLWQEAAWLQPTEDLVKMLALAGFGGVYVNRDGFPDDGAAITGDLGRLLATDPVVSPDGRACVYDLAGYTQRLRSALGEEEWAAAREAALHPALFRWQDGFSYLEGMPGHQWRWCAAEGDLYVENGSGREKKVSVEMGFTTATGAPARLGLSGLGIDEGLTIAAAGGATWKRVLRVPPGRHRVHFTCDAAPVPPGIDPRDLHFRVENFSAREFNDVPAPVAPTQP